MAFPPPVRITTGVWRALAERAGERADELVWLASETLGVPRHRLLTGDGVVSRLVWWRFLLRFRGLRRGIPLAHLLGTVPFDGMTLLSDPRALIPRPETEELVALVAEKLAPRPGERLLDAGTGSGCIALALARRFPSLEVTAIDVSARALSLAKRNELRIFGRPGRIRWLRGDARDGAFLRNRVGDVRFDLLVSNPPYVASGDPLDEAVRRWEPGLALFGGGADGLDFARALVDAFDNVKSPSARLALELGGDQPSEFASWFSPRALRDAIIHDMAGKSRFYAAWLRPEPTC